MVTTASIFRAPRIEQCQLRTYDATKKQCRSGGSMRATQAISIRLWSAIQERHGTFYANDTFNDNLFAFVFVDASHPEPHGGRRSPTMEATLD